MRLRRPIARTAHLSDDNSIAQLTLIVFREIVGEHASDNTLLIMYAYIVNKLGYLRDVSRRDDTVTRHFDRTIRESVRRDIVMSNGSLDNVINCVIKVLLCGLKSNQLKVGNEEMRRK